MPRSWTTTTGLRLGAVGVVTALVLLVAPAAAGAAGLAITVPTSANLGSVTIGTATTSGHLGVVTVTDNRLLAVTWTATVSASNFTTGSATSAETIDKGSISYLSGPVTASSGLAVRAPGQLTLAVSLSAPRTAFSALGTVLVANSTSWNPTIAVTIPAAVVAGSYTGTITHSVA